GRKTAAERGRGPWRAARPRARRPTAGRNGAGGEAGWRTSSSSAWLGFEVDPRFRIPLRLHRVPPKLSQAIFQSAVTSRRSTALHQLTPTGFPLPASGGG